MFGILSRMRRAGFDVDTAEPMTHESSSEVPDEHPVSVGEDLLARVAPLR